MLLAAMVERGPFHALFTDASLVSRNSATSVACQRTTSRSSSTAR